MLFYMVSHSNTAPLEKMRVECLAQVQRQIFTLSAQTFEPATSRLLVQRSRLPAMDPLSLYDTHRWSPNVQVFCGTGAGSSIVWGQVQTVHISPGQRGQHLTRRQSWERGAWFQSINNYMLMSNTQFIKHENIIDYWLLFLTSNSPSLLDKGVIHSYYLFKVW